MGLGLLEGDVPTFGVSIFNSSPLFPSSQWTMCHPASGDAPTSCASVRYPWTDIWITNHIAMAIIGAALVIAFWLIVSHNMKLVPGKRQWIGEYLYNMIRNGVAREVIGENYAKYVPYLVALFSFIIINNLFGELFVFMFPTFSKIGFVWALAILTWLLYNGVGIKKYGFFRYLKKMVLPPGVPWPLWIIIIPLEFLSNILIRPITLAVRLFANLFAGHLLVSIFVVGGTWLFTYSNHKWFFNAAGGVSIVVSFGIFALELLVAYLQAYVFTVLTAQYVSSAEAAEH